MPSNLTGRQRTTRAVAARHVRADDYVTLGSTTVRVMHSEPRAGMRGFWYFAFYAQVPCPVGAPWRALTGLYSDSAVADSVEVPENTLIQTRIGPLHDANDRAGYDRAGYDRAGYDRAGYDRAGLVIDDMFSPFDDSIWDGESSA